jgi:peptide deformylase
METSKLELIKQNDPILKTPTTPFVFTDSERDPRKLAEDLANKMIELRGVGLAAPQVGIPLSVFVVGDPSNKESIMAFFNPTIVDNTIEQTYQEEGCLSFPGLYINIKRPNGIRLRFTDMYGETTTIKYSGFTARAIQHEYDHLQGVLFKSKATKYHLEKAMKDHKLLARRSSI